MTPQSCTQLNHGPAPRRHVRPKDARMCHAIGSDWVASNDSCLECGHVGCCDQSPNKHAYQALSLDEAPP
jgi:hypothetical protein